MALFQCVLAAFVAAGVAVQPEAPVRRHREQVAGDCTDHSAFDGGGASWQGRCKTLDQCRDSCAQSNNCVAFNWWSKRGGCRHYSNTGYTKRTTAHTTIGGAPACHYDKAGPTDCDACSSNCQQETEAPAPEYPEDCDDTKYFMGTPYHQTEIRGTSDFADMVKKCKSQYMDAGGFGGWSQRYSNGNGWCARFTREPTQQEWDSAGKSACAAYPGASGHCGAVCGTKFNDGVAPAKASTHFAVSGSYKGASTGHSGGFTKKQVEKCLPDSTTAVDNPDRSGLTTMASLEMGTVCCDSSGVGTRPGCKTGTYADAEKHCNANGKTLCSLAQLKNGAGEARGCHFDGKLVWSSDTCQA